MRTDRTLACIYCRLRLPRDTGRCPRCRDDRHLVDLETDDGHARLEARESRRRRGRWLLSGALASVGAAATVWVTLGHAGLAEALLIVAVALMLGAVFQGGWGLLRPLRIRDPEPDEDADESTVEGRAVALSRMPAPGANDEVVGYRLVGRSVRGPVDDARLEPFVVVTDDGAQIDVDAAHAVLDVPLAPAEVEVERSLCRRWGGDPVGAGFRVGVLADGAPVRVAGVRDGDRLRGSLDHPVRVSAVAAPEKMRS